MYDIKFMVKLISVTEPLTLSPSSQSLCQKKIRQNDGFLIFLILTKINYTVHQMILRSQFLWQM